MYICLAFAPGSLQSAVMSTCMYICLAFAPGSLLSGVMSTCMNIYFWHLFLGHCCLLL